MQPYAQQPVVEFGGLNLRDDPQEVGWQGAIDLLNIDLDRRGRVRQRDGVAVFATPPAAGANGSRRA
ncbi:MAG: hypothetical protein KY396_08780 [Actinobacteria bacterium]|nr:hypothetical protein [Actinomycetota bacterium]